MYKYRSFINYKYTRSISLSIGIANHIRCIKAIDALRWSNQSQRFAETYRHTIQNRQISLRTCHDRIRSNNFENSSSCRFDSADHNGWQDGAQFDISSHFDTFENRFLEYTTPIRKIHNVCTCKTKQLSLTCRPFVTSQIALRATSNFYNKTTLRCYWLYPCGRLTCRRSVFRFTSL